MTNINTINLMQLEGAAMTVDKGYYTPQQIIVENLPESMIEWKATISKKIKDVTTIFFNKKK